MLNDREMGEKLYTDLDIAEHTILIEGLPRDVPREELERKIRSIFIDLLELENIPNAEGQILRVVAVSDFDKCLKWSKKLKIFIGRY